MEESTVNNQEQLPSEEKSSFRYFPFFDNKQPVFVLVIIGLVFYCTSLYNEYALDDGIIIHQNNYVLKGVRGVKDILTTDSYDSFYKRMNAKDQLQGGRYRPLAVVSFAIEQELIGPYRTGNYMQAEDLNKNGVLDDDEVSYDRNYTKSNQHALSTNIQEKSIQTHTYTDKNYEYNNYVDHNNDGVAQPEECFNCWDLNRNFHNDASEDRNSDGIFNEVDCQVYGAMLRHFNNIWIYVLACVLLYILFRNYLMRDNPDMAFLAALIFLTHPIHSSVIANVKSRDEIFCLMFMALSLIYAFKFMQDKKFLSMVLSGLMLFLSLMSKEYGILLFVMTPMAIYIFNNYKIEWKGLLLPAALFLLIFSFMAWTDIKSIYFGIHPMVLFASGFLLYLIVSFVAFRKTLLNKDLNSLMVCLFGFGLFYFTLRLNAVNMAPGVPDTEILNNPFLLASDVEAFATKIYVLLKSLLLLIFPHPLISDYSYATIAYRSLTDWDFILSAIVHLALVYVGIKLVLKRHILGFAIVTYLLLIFMVSNLVLNIGATLVEGCLFNPTIGFAIVLAWFTIKGFDKMQFAFSTKRTAMLTMLCVLVVLYGCKTWERNWDWKNDVTLFLKDVKNSPNSVLVLGNAGARWIDLADTKEITGIPYPGEDPDKFNDYNGTLKITDEDVKAGNYSSKKEAALYRGIGYLEHAVELHPRYVNGYLNLGLAHFKLGKEKEAITYWKRAEHLYPNNPYLKLYYKVYSGILKEKGTAAFEERNFSKAVAEFKKWTLIKPEDPEALYNLGSAHFNLKNYSKAEKYWKKALELNSGDEEIKKALETIPK